MNWLIFLIYGAAGLAGLVALAVLLFRPRAVSSWLFATGVLGFGLELLCSGFGLVAVLPEEVMLWQRRHLWFLSLLPGVWLLFSLCYSRGNYRQFLSRWWLVWLVSFGLPLTLVFYFRDDLLAGVMLAPGTSEWVVTLGWAGRGLHLLAICAFVLVLVNLERTFRAAVGTMRWRIKFVVLGMAVLFAARVYSSSQTFLYSGTSQTRVAVVAVALLVAGLLWIFSVRRTGLFEIELYPSHAVLTNSLTVLIAGFYLIIVGVLAKLVAVLGGEGGFPVRAALVLLGLVGLAVLLLSDRLRQRVRKFVSRHFQRPVHDYRRLWTLFSQRTALIVDQTELCRAVAKLVSETFEAMSVTVWLVDGTHQALAFGASTILSEEKARELLADRKGSEQALWGIRGKLEPFDLDEAKEVWVTVLQRYHPDYFRKGGKRLAVPLSSGSDVVGLIMLGDRVAGAPFSEEDLELLKCIAAQTAAFLLNLKLSARLIEAKEMEAFQTMSAFFVHDLKNTASTLSLMLQNLPVHFNDPAFREDAIRAVAKSAERINSLITRLTVLRQGLKLTLVEADLNQVVQETLRAFAGATDFALVVRLGSLPRIALDPEQIQKVLTNLVLNAKEALRNEGRIEVTTAVEGGWVVLSVQDNGCGMSPEFASRQLFRPFQTTKKKGIGIGMFHTKMIVEAHGGRIEVQSILDEGTTFRVYLPVEIDPLQRGR